MVLKNVSNFLSTDMVSTPLKSRIFSTTNVKASNLTQEILAKKQKTQNVYTGMLNYCDTGKCNWLSHC